MYVPLGKLPNMLIKYIHIHLNKYKRLFVLSAIFQSLRGTKTSQNEFFGHYLARVRIDRF